MLAYILLTLSLSFAYAGAAAGAVFNDKNLMVMGSVPGLLCIVLCMLVFGREKR